MSFVKVENDMGRTLINHHPTALITSTYQGKININTVAWWSIVQDYPLYIMISLHHKSLTYEFACKQSTLIMNILGQEYKEVYNYAGTHSGKNIDKIKKLNLPINNYPCTSLPMLENALVSFKITNIQRQQFQRFDVFIYEVDDFYINNALLLDNLIDWSKYKTLQFIDDNRFFISKQIEECNHSTAE